MGLFGFGRKKNDQSANIESAVTRASERTDSHTSTPSPAPASYDSISSISGNVVSLDLRKDGILNLTKNDLLDLSKTDSTLRNIRCSAGWDVNDSRYGQDYDLDLCAYLLGSNGRLAKGIKNTIYYGDKRGTGIQLDHDNLTGEGDGDDENMFIDFSRIPDSVQKILVCVVIYQGASRSQTFKHVKNAYVRLVDEGVSPEQEICRYNLSADGGNNTAVRFAELIRTGEGWVFKALGDLERASIGDIQDELR